ncbi:MAG TPA: prepilin-type N-terminal cleavage/methylation domain-containing protein [Syntrophobacteraceae bacterium]|nr:prepilin-type N-terminal cleavage/methylation domain-containing protein [Syntrophobacteraceae bacterium]
MKINCSSVSGSRGFTLVELIVTIVITAIMAAMYIQVTGVSLMGNVQQINTLSSSMALYQVMEAMVSDYHNLMVTSSTPLATFTTRVQNNAGHYGTYTLVYNGYVTYSAGGVESSASGTGTGAQTLKVKISNGVITLTTLFTQ